MKILTTYFMVFVALAFVFPGCGHDGGQIGIPGTIGEVPLSSATDSDGVSLDGAIIDPSKAIIVNFDNAVSSVIAYAECDGEAVDLNIIPVSATQFKILPVDNRFPQKTDCELRVAAIGTSATVNTTTSVSADLVDLAKQDATLADSTFTILNFSVGCDYIDLFDTSLTFDPTADTDTAGTGCCKAVGSKPPSEMVEIFGGLLHIKSLQTDSNSYVAVYKRIGGKDYEATIALSDLAHKFNMGAESEGVTVALIISNDLSQFGQPDATAAGAFAAYQERWVGPIGEMAYRCTTGANFFKETVIDPCGDGSSVPYIGLIINEGGIITPFYSFDGGVTKKFFALEDVNSTSYDLRENFAGLDDLDLGVLTIGEHVISFGEAFIDSFWVDGDVWFVK